MVKLFRSALLLGIVSMMWSCETKRPVLYPNEQLRRTGWAVAEEDIDTCIQLAAEAGLETHPGSKVAGEAAKNAATGAVVGVAVGAVTGNIGRGAAVGAAGGGAGGFMWGLFGSRDLDPVQRRYVEECLREQGYLLIGWH